MSIVPFFLGTVELPIQMRNIGFKFSLSQLSKKKFNNKFSQ